MGNHEKRQELDPRAAGAKRFADKVVIITGAGQGIGMATAKRLAAEGATLMLADRVEETTREFKKELADHGVTAEIFLGDLREYEEAERLVQETHEAFGRIDVLVNNVGGTIWIKPYEEYEAHEIEKEIDRSLWTAMWCCRAAIAYMKIQGSGAIVNVGSTSPRGIYRVPYSAAKGGVIALTTSLALEVAEQGYEFIRLNCVAPGSTKNYRPTPRNEYQSEMSDKEKQWQTELNAHHDHKYPLRRMGYTYEHAAAIAFLASDDASYITAQILTVAGGAVAL